MAEDIPQDYSSQPLVTQLVEESEAMARFALASGLPIPASVAYTLHEVRTTLPNDAAGSKGSPSIETSRPGNHSTATPALVRKLNKAHAQLSRIVVPATPTTILFLNKEKAKKSWTLFLGPIGAIRWIILAAFFFLVALVTVSLSEDISTSASGNFMESSGWPLLAFELFYLSAAGLGACFAALFEANRYIVTTTFDPKYTWSYLYKIALGVIAGFMLAALIPLETLNGEVVTPPTKPMLAILGGFSSSLVYRILTSMVETIGALFQGGTEARIKAESQQAHTRALAEVERMRLSLASELMNVQKQLSEGPGQEDARRSVNRLLEELLPTELEAPLQSDAPAPALPAAATTNDA